MMMKNLIRSFCLISFYVVGLFALSGLTGCTTIFTAHGAYYRVQSGDTLESIAKKYKIGEEEIAEANHLDTGAALKPGHSLYIPGATPSGIVEIIKREKHAPKKQRPKKPLKRGEKEPQGKSAVKDKALFSWPLVGEISSPFGIRRGHRHDGIDIRSPQGTPIAAAGAGEIVYSKRMRGYGNVILIKHANDYFTVYAHNSVNLAKLGSHVKTGDVIAKVGRTGRATGPHLHFEVREETQSRNPLLFLPENQFSKLAAEKSNSNEEVLKALPRKKSQKTKPVKQKKSKSQTSKPIKKGEPHATSHASDRRPQKKN